MSRYGQNRGYIEELHARYLDDPDSVSTVWRDFFADYRPEPSTPVPGKSVGRAAQAEPLRGVSGRIAENMTESLEVPTATSARTIAVKTLEENRRVINLHQQSITGPKISYTHLIAWTILRALEKFPEMNACYAELEGKPHRVNRSSVNLGVAIDTERQGRRILLVPNLKRAETLDFPGFVAAFDELVAKAKQNRLEVDDYQDTTMTLTNPGMIGTGLSVPRLMPGQGAIIGVGSIGYAPEYAGMDPGVISQLGLSKVMTLTSTYDHRILQGATSGAFLAALAQLLQGENGLYERVFAELRVPREPIAWAADRNPPILNGTGNMEAIAKQAGVHRLIRAYRVRGHLRANLDPLGASPVSYPELELSYYGLTLWDLDRKFIARGLGNAKGPLPLREILDTLNRTYCRHVGVEYMHIQDPVARAWLQERLEQPEACEPPPREEQIRILKKLNSAEAFESFVGKKYPGQKRFSLEGAETLIPMLDTLLGESPDHGVQEIIVGMAHRGRLNVLANTIGKSYEQIFREFEGDIDPTTAHGSGDVKYHLGASGEYVAADGRKVRVSVASNPSHLEAVDPVVEGMVRALQDRAGDTARNTVLPLLLHGDAAFSGQGVIAETLNLSELKGYRTGGTIHIVVNNQIGFTTGPADLRSSYYPTDVAKMVQAPIFHVNGDEPEDAVRMTRLALAYRQTFKRDVVVDLVCYRRWGHNEADDPSYTHPILYTKIKAHRSVRKLYTEQLLRRGDFDPETAELALEDFQKRLRRVHTEVREAQRDRDAVTAAVCLESTAGVASPAPTTGVAPATLEQVLDGLVDTPSGFQVHAKLARQLAARRQQFEEGKIQWALAEALGFGSLVLEGTPVRLSGEDSGRGTFSQRHAILHDTRTGTPHTPLQHLDPGQAAFHVFDSLLSEFAVLGFEYGYSVAHPEALVLWEAQFGDFVNGAQVIIDQFLASAEDKWDQQSGVVLLLPHAFEGQGPEHSSARLERFLQLAARGNLRVSNPSTPAQYFHLLRSQVRRSERKPLIVLTPKSLLRHRECVSTAAQLAEGRFEQVLDDAQQPDPQRVERLLLCSGKVFYDLQAQRAQGDSTNLALCRVEWLYPFPNDAITSLLDRYPAAQDIVWVQEEPRNMGAWAFIQDRLPELLGSERKLRYVGRPRSASSATGSLKRHQAEQDMLVREALESRSLLALPEGGA
jgi:2-oxoglutarate dehydrogenase E1 component